MQMNRIDVHQHILPPAYAAALADAGLASAGGVPLPQWSADAAIAMMDRQGIAAAITSISTPGVHFGDAAFARRLARTCNGFSADLASRHPARFGGFAILPLPDVDGALAELDYALDTLRLDGVVLLASNSDGTYLGDPKLDPVLAELDRRRTVTFVHPTVHPSTGQVPLTIPPFATEFVFDTSRAIANLIWMGAAERYPNIRFIFSHAGGTAPYLAWRWNLLNTTPRAQEHFPHGFLYYLSRFYYDTALSGSDYALSALTQLVPSGQILFGSDFPFAPEAVGAAAAKGVERFGGLSSDDRQRIWRGNAQMLFPRFVLPHA